MSSAGRFDQLPFEGRRGYGASDGLQNLALGAVAAVVAISIAIWFAGQLSARIFSGAWPAAGPGSALAVVLHLIANPARPADAWPVADRHLIPAPLPFYGTLGVVLLALGTVAATVAGTWARGAAKRRGRHTNPDRRGYARVSDLPPAKTGKDELVSNFGLGPNLFLGVEDGLGGLRAVRTRSVEENSGITGPPRMLKTLGQMGPALMTWYGPAVSTSSRPDVLRQTGAARERLARQHGGRIHVLDLTGKVAAPFGLATMHLDPLAGCRDTSVVSRRVETWLSAGGSMSDDIMGAQFFRAHGATLLRPMVHAAALEDLGIRQVIRWLNTREVEEPSLIIQRHNSPGIEWVEAMRSLGNSSAHVTVDNFFQTAMSALKALQDPAVLDLCEHSDFDVEEFLATRSTLYIIDPRGDGGLSPYAPLQTAAVEWVVENAYDRALRSPNGRCDPALLLNLDELPNIAPLPSLPNILSMGGGQGVLTNWACQSFAQLRERYGKEKAQTILTSTTYQILLGGLRDRADLEDISALAGDYEEWEDSRSRTDFSGDTVSRHRVRRRVLPVEVLASLPQGEAVLIHRGQAIRLQLRAMPEVPALAKLIGAPTPQHLATA
jgi:type IV secretion system protein VirD4